MTKTWSPILSRELPSETDVPLFCREILPILAPGQVWLLNGPVGAGKTTFMRHLTRSLGHRGLFQSPTFTLVQEYGPFPSPPGFLRHGDLYRLMGQGGVSDLGLFEDEFSGALFLEWGMDFPEVVARATHRLDLALKGEGREVTVWRADPTAP